MVELIKSIPVLDFRDLPDEVPISIDTDGSIFNGCGYIEGKRLSSMHGVYKDGENSFLSGYIPCTADDIILIPGDVQWQYIEVSYEAFNATSIIYGGGYDRANADIMNILIPFRKTNTVGHLARYIRISSSSNPPVVKILRNGLSKIIT